MADLFLATHLGFPGPQSIDMLVRKWSTDPSKYRGIELLPDEESYLPTIQWDEYGPIVGMTGAHTLDADPANVTMPVLNSFQEFPMYFKEKSMLKESDMLNIRTAGSLGNKDAARKAVAELVLNINARLDVRLEWLRWQAMMGSITLTAAADGVARVQTYNVLTPATASPLWSSTTTADPISDLQTWIAGFRGNGTGKVSVWYNRTTSNLLSKNSIVRDLLKQSINLDKVNSDNVGEFIGMSLAGGIGSMNLYDEGYVNSSGVFTPFIPDGKVIMVSNPPMGQKRGGVQFVPSLHNGGLDPRPGRFSMVLDYLQKENPSYGLMVGAYCLPVIRFPQVFKTATVA